MTIQNWVLKPDSAMIICDTLATGGADNSPSSFMEKAWIIPHRSIMIAALDWPYPAQTLYSHLAMGYAPARSDDLVHYAANIFREAAESLPNSKENYPGAGVAVFMWVEDRNEIDGWMFHISHDFAAVRLPRDMCLLNPPSEDIVGKRWYEIAVEQQTEDRLLPIRHRNNIGGSLIAYEMKVAPSGQPPSISIFNFGTMPHYEEQAAQVAEFKKLHGTVEPIYTRT